MVHSYIAKGWVEITVCMYVFKDRAFCLNLGLSLIVGVRLEKEGLEELNSHPHKRKCKRMFQIVKYLV